MNWLYLVPAVFCFFVGFIILFYAFMIGKKVVGVFVFVAFIIFFLYNYFSENFLLKDLEPILFFSGVIIGLMVIFCLCFTEMEGVGFFISGASIMLSSYYFFRGFFLEEQYDTLTLLRSAALFVALSSVSFLWGIMEQKFGRKKKIRIHYYE